VLSKLSCGYDGAMGMMKPAARQMLGRLLRIPPNGSPLPQRARLSGAVASSDPIPAPQILAGDPVASSLPLVASADDGFSASLWTCTPGTFRWFYRSDEIIHVLEGEVRVTPDQGGEPFEATDGDVVYFPRDSSAVWEIRKAIRKLALFRSDTADPLGQLRGALTRRPT
jgi:uncharacterized protein